MEQLGWCIYLCSVAGKILAFASIFFVICLVTSLIVYLAYCNDDCELETVKKWWKYNGIIGVISMMFIVLVPSKSTCYQIFGVTVATEVIKNSEELQKLPENVIKTINVLLESITEDNEKKE